VWLAHGLREGAGLIAAGACEVVWQVLLQGAHRLPEIRDRPLGAEFSVAVTVHLAPSQGGADKVVRQPDTVRQYGNGEFVCGIFCGRRLTRSSPKVSTICIIPSSAPFI
jgi:hypothetical protein